MHNIIHGLQITLYTIQYKYNKGKVLDSVLSHRVDSSVQE